LAKADTNTASDAVSPSKPQTSTAVAGFSKLRWPVAGKVIAGFGPRPDGTHNDGVNLAAPMGTDVHAAESGVVAYSGDELKGYGKLVLIRHDNGWVTAYAHADELLVKRGDQIRRGQVIAKAGRTGQVDQPQVHFELRQGQKPVDPTPFMERL
jgi:murein DD-endopeptidase MepM/ murein hydrolase activator NlpD